MAAPRPIPIRPAPFQIGEELALGQIANAIAAQSKHLLEIRQELTAIKEIMVAIALQNLACR